MREFRHFLLRREKGEGADWHKWAEGRDWALLFALWKQTSNWIADSIGLNKIN